MADRNDLEESVPALKLQTPTTLQETSQLDQGHIISLHARNSKVQDGKHLDPSESMPSIHPLPGHSRPVSSSGHDIYLGSYRRPRSTRELASGTNTPFGSITPPSHNNKSQEQLSRLLDHLDIASDTYGLEEHRDGFFDAMFLSPRLTDASDLLNAHTETLKQTPRSMNTIIKQNADEVKYFLYRITTTRAGLKLTKTCLSFFIAYFICLIPVARDWLGRYNFVMPLSAILNHSGRPVGAQIDGCILTIMGTAGGLGWGALALYASTSTEIARAGYGGILATFLVIFTGAISYLRAVLIRFYQFVICAGIAVVYTTLADASETVSWKKVFDYGIPFVLGQGIALLVASTVYPDTGSRAIAVTFHRAMVELYKALELPRRNDAVCRRNLATAFVSLSDATRDFTIDFSITRFRANDIRALRNFGQAAIRSAMALESTEVLPELQQISISTADNVLNVEMTATGEDRLNLQNTHDAVVVLAKMLSNPVTDLLLASRDAIGAVDDTILTMSGYRRYIQPAGSSSPSSRFPKTADIDHDVAATSAAAVGIVPNSLSGTPERSLIVVLSDLQRAIKSFDEADAKLLEAKKLPVDYAENPKLVEILMFVHSARQVATFIHIFASQVLEVQDKNSKLRLNLPSYPLAKALNRTNAQVRHDRGGLTVGFYFRTKKQLERTLQDLQSRVYVPLPEQHQNDVTTRDFQTKVDNIYNDEKIYLESRTSSQDAQKATIRYKIWKALHNLQGFETRFALKVTIVTTLLSIPAWLPQSKVWWNANESWFAVIMVWVMMHPRVGGNLQDLFTRTFTTALGVIWAGFAFAADNGNPYVIAVFAAIFMIPMLYRFSQSSHPRSGLAGCMSFTIISLSAYTDTDISRTSIVHMTWTRGLAFVIGITAAVMINWVIWPFIARHELRKSVSTMLLHIAILYRGIVSQYVYPNAETPPTPADVARSEMLEGRLREAFVRIRQLLDLTAHEIRLRAPFDPRPFAALIDECERIFNALINIRQFSLYFRPVLAQSDAAANAALLPLRRDAVASILMVLYTLAGALKTARPLPRYLPSVVAARKRLLDRMAELTAATTAVTPAMTGDTHGKEDAVVKNDETVTSAKSVKEKGKYINGQNERRKWADVYQYAYSKTLTDVVEQVERLQAITRLITGDVGFDLDDDEGLGE